jgi:hypothetical protein
MLWAEKYFKKKKETIPFSFLLSGVSAGIEDLLAWVLCEFFCVGFVCYVCVLVFFCVQV